MNWTDEQVADFNARRHPQTTGQMRSGRVKGIAPKAERSYNGRTYHSKAECKKAQELDFMLKAGSILDWSPQPRYPINILGTWICDIVPDFVVYHTDGSKELIEVKGWESEVWKLKKQLLLACYPQIKYTVEKV